jgi:hypothetical protein
MYLATIILLMLVLPALAVAIEAIWFPGAAGLIALIGKWFTFFVVGIRLFSGGVSQVIRPEFTAKNILGVEDPGANVLVRELGFGNLAIGTLGLLSLAFPSFRIPAAVAGAVFLGLAGLGHVFRKNRNAKEQAALVSDLLAAAVLAAFVTFSLCHL